VSVGLPPGAPAARTRALAGFEAVVIVVLLVLLFSRNDGSCGAGASGAAGVGPTGAGAPPASPAAPGGLPDAGAGGIGAPSATASLGSVGIAVPVGPGPAAPAAPTQRPTTGPTACAAISPDDVAAVIARPVGAPEATGDAPDANTCTWDPGSGLVVVQVVPPNYWEPHHAGGYTELAGIAEAAYVERNLTGDGYVAGALLADRAITADVGGPGSTAEQAVALVRLAVERLA
jgi:hypothetical protein